MHKTLTARLKPLAAAAVCCASAASAQPDFGAFDRYTAQAAQEWRVPGLSIAVVKDDATVFARGYGTTSIEAGTPVDADTLFSIGSTTKAFAAAGIGILVDEGKLGWDDPVVQHLPGFRLADLETTQLLRVRDLLTHNFGVPNTDLLWYEQTNTLNEILSRMKHVDLAEPSYRGFTYQNVMYAAAGKLTEVVAGQPWPDFIEERIFKPLGMKRSVATLAGTAYTENVARPHFLIDGSVTPISNASVDAVAAAGSIWSSANEMALWARSLLRGCTTADGKPLLQPITCAELFKPHAIINAEMYPAMRLYEHQWFTYALGWFQTDYNRRALNFHSGSIDGLVALHGLVRDENLGVIILGNLDHAEVRHALMYRALDLYDARLAAEDRRDWHREIKDLFDDIATARTAAAQAQESNTTAPESKRPALPDDSYAGEYRGTLLGTLVIRETDSGLELRHGKLVCTLEHLGGDTFQCPWRTRWRGISPVQFLTTAEAPAASVRFRGVEFIRQ